MRIVREDGSVEDIGTVKEVRIDHYRLRVRTEAGPAFDLHEKRATHIPKVNDRHLNNQAMMYPTGQLYVYAVGGFRLMLSPDAGAQGIGVMRAGWQAPIPVRIHEEANA